MYSDPVTFYVTVLEYRKVEYARTVDWVLTNSAELLFRDASKLVFTGDRGKKKKEKCLTDKFKIVINRVQSGTVPEMVRTGRYFENGHS